MTNAAKIKSLAELIEDGTAAAADLEAAGFHVAADEARPVLHVDYSYALEQATMNVTVEEKPVKSLVGLRCLSIAEAERAAEAAFPTHRLVWKTHTPGTAGQWPDGFQMFWN